MKAESKLLRTNFALDSIMCSIEGELSDLLQNPPKKIKEVKIVSKDSNNNLS